MAPTTRDDTVKVCVRPLIESDFACALQLSGLSDKVAYLELQLETGAQQKQEAVERGTSLEMKVAELEQQLEAASQPHATNYAFEQNAVAAERDLLKRELELFMEQTELQCDQEALRKETEESKAMEGFLNLEFECMGEYERELLAEISTLKRTAEDDALQVQKLGVQIAQVQEELKWQKILNLAQETLRQQTQLQQTQQLEELESLREERSQLKRPLQEDSDLMKQVEEKLQELQVEQLHLKAEVESFHQPCPANRRRSQNGRRELLQRIASQSQADGKEPSGAVTEDQKVEDRRCETQ